MKYIKILLAILVFTSINAQTPAAKQDKTYTIVGATAHIGNGDIIENSKIVFTNGKITFVGANDNNTDDNSIVIDAKGKDVYPGFIACNTTLGLGEIDAVKATIDQDETGTMLPHIRSIIAYNAESKVTETMRPNGVLMAQITPRGGVISGTSSVVQLDAWNWEDASIKTDGGIHLNWPNSYSYTWKTRSFSKNKKYAEQIADLNDYFTKAKAYSNSNKTPRNLPLEGMEGVFNGKKTVFIHANAEKEMRDAIAFAKEMKVTNIVMVNANAADKIADILVENNIPVILDRSHRMPDSQEQAYDYPFTLAKKLMDKGVMISIGTQGGMERMNSRNLPFYAGTHAAYGLSKEQALSLITLNAAKILGIDNKVGSLEVGKDATLFISTGDALDMMTNNIEHSFVQGRKISLETHQTKLWKKYTEKYKR
ncbi:MAG: amidohydrolase family protein [Flavobacteriaceae bacterium]|nr:amidohydrolase family protein [Flavobacteriaceae bacterium]